MNPCWYFIWTAARILIFVTASQGFMNLYLSRDETFRLLGLRAELYYIREGQINDYALKFVVPVPPHISELHFTWESLTLSPTPYSIALSVSDMNALDVITINITRKGNVPRIRQVFRIVLPCTGKVNAEVDVNICINITMTSSWNITALTLKRKKICLKNSTPSTTTDETNVLTDASLMLVPSSPIYIAVACASGLILISSISAAMCYVRSHKGRANESTSYGGASLHLSFSKPGQAFLRVDGPSNCTTLSKTGSHYSSFRRMTTPASMYQTTVLTVPVHNELNMSTLSSQLTEVAISRRSISLKDKLQEGTFGRVYSGIYIRGNGELEENVMIKTISDQASKLQVSLFVTEGMTMFGLNNRYVLNVIAACIDDPQRPLLVYPLMNKGNLKLFLQKCKFSAEGQSHTLLTQDKVLMAIQIAQGMIYLHRNKLIHKDLAARNCVLSEHDDGSCIVKITDNSLSGDLFPNDYHCLGDNENRPVKWLAMESLINDEFIGQSDVWAFGVTLWELMTLCQQPYFEVDPFEMRAYLRDGYRLFQPINCPDKLYDIMVCCWNAMPEDRPTFTQLLSCLQDFYMALGKYI